MMFSLIRWFRALLGYNKYSAETFDRLIQSRHVEDLRWIARVTTGAAALAIAAIAIIAYKVLPTPQVGASKLYEVLVPFQISAVLASLGGIIAWCYQTGSARLGIVDLFACEITTLCRIWTINGLAENCIREFELDTSKLPPPTVTRLPR
jgi:hypothetical protein